MFCNKDVFKNFAKFTGKHLRQSHILKKSCRPQPTTLLEKRFWHRCFPVNFVELLRTPFLHSTSGGCFCIHRSRVKPFLKTETKNPLKFVYVTKMSKTTQTNRKEKIEFFDKIYVSKAIYSTVLYF